MMLFTLFMQLPAFVYKAIFASSYIIEQNLTAIRQRWLADEDKKLSQKFETAFFIRVGDATSAKRRGTRRQTKIGDTLEHK